MKRWICWISEDVILRPCIAITVSMTGSITNEARGRTGKNARMNMFLSHQGLNCYLYSYFVQKSASNSA